VPTTARTRFLSSSSIGELSATQDRTSTSVGDESPQPSEVLIKEARRRQRRRWALIAIALVVMGGLVWATAGSQSPPPRRSVRPHHGIDARALRTDAHGLATCSTLGVPSPPPWPPPTPGSSAITALGTKGLSRTSLRLIEDYAPANCASAQYVAPAEDVKRPSRWIVVVQFPTQLTSHDREVLAAGDETYLRRTGAFVYVSYRSRPTTCSKAVPCP
jgi:hypothetical protein